MSGGSYGYLCLRTREGGIGAYRDELAQMAERLQTSGHYQAARYTREVIRLLDGAELIADTLTDVWHAVEWADSGDYSEDQVKEAAGKFRPPGSFLGAGTNDERTPA